MTSQLSQESGHCERVAVLALNDAVPFDVAVPCQLFVVAGLKRATSYERAIPASRLSRNVHRPVPCSEHAPVTIDEMASHASMSRRSFTRSFRDETGLSPLQWLLDQRIDLARRLETVSG